MVPTIGSAKNYPFYTTNRGGLDNAGMTKAIPLEVPGTAGFGGRKIGPAKWHFFSVPCEMKISDSYPYSTFMTYLKRTNRNYSVNPIDFWQKD